MCNGYYHKLKSGTYDLNTFYVNRYKRTVPFFAILIFLDCVIEFSPEALYEGLMEVTMLFGFLPNNSLNVIGVAWTLGAIFAFYIIFPFTVFLLYSRRRAIMSFAVSILIMFMCQNYFMTKKFVSDSFVMRHSFLYCLPFFLMGELIFLYKNEISSVVNKFKWICLFVLLALTLGYYITPNIWASVDIVVIKTLMLYYVKMLRMTEYQCNSNHRFRYFLYQRRKNIEGAKLGISIFHNTIDKGLRIYHYGAIIVNSHAKIGKDCKLHGNNCIGNKGEYDRYEAPILGDNVDVGIGAKIIGGIEIASNVKIGANSNRNFLA